jgi:hypothetical protein
MRPLRIEWMGRWKVESLNLLGCARSRLNELLKKYTEKRRWALGETVS